MKNYCTWCHQTDEFLTSPGKPIAPISLKSPTCPQCHREITLMTFPRACQIVGISRKTMYQWVDKKLVSAVRSASGRLLICFSSLFDPSDEDNEVIKNILTDKKD